MNYPYQNNQYLQNLLLQQAQGQSQEVVKVSGINGVNAYQMTPNSSVLLLDTTAPIVWLVQTDGAGYAELEDAEHGQVSCVTTDHHNF